MAAYDSSLFDPPAPVALVGLRDPDSRRTSSSIAMLIDSGSDVSVVPKAAIDDVGLEIDSDAGFELEGFDGRTTLARTVQLDLIFVGRVFKGKYVIIDSNMGILGRDVLNHVAILLDGPQLSWQEHDTSPR